MSFDVLEGRITPTHFFNPLPSTLDGTLGSLRADINLANTNADPINIFTLKAGTYNLVALGDLQLTAAKTYQFVGNGSGSTFIDAKQFERVFEITTTATVLFKNLTITGGQATDGGSVGGTDALGGGILNKGGSVKLDSAILKNNIAQGSQGSSGTAGNINGGNGAGAQGGGIYSTGGSLTLVNYSSILSNKANGGAGGRGFDNNRFATVGNGGNGGSALGAGLYTLGTTVNINGGIISSNVDRAGIGGSGGDKTGSSGSAGNGGNGGNAQGGGLYASGGSVTITGRTMASNKAFGANGGQGGKGTGQVARGGDGGNGGLGQGGGLYGTGVGTLNLTLLSINPDNSAVGGNGGVGGHGGTGGDTGGDGGNGGSGGAGQGGGIYTVASKLRLTTSTINAGHSVGGNGGIGGVAGNGGDGSGGGGPGGNGGNGGDAGVGQGGGLFDASGNVVVFRSTTSASTAVGGKAGNAGNGGKNLTTSSSGGNGGNGGAGGNAQGAGVFAGAGSLTLSDSTLAGNNVGGPNSGAGGNGGIGGAGGPIGGNGGTGGMAGNGGVSQGGALFNLGALVQLRNSTIALNQANIGGKGGNGGAGGNGVVGGTGGAGGNRNTNGTAGKPPAGGTGGAGGVGGASAGGQGGGVANSTSTVTVVSTIIAKNTFVAGFGASGVGPDIFRALISLGHNLIGNRAGGTGFTFHLNADLVGGNGHPLIDPMLGPLANYGGPTFTLALLFSSPAIDAGSNPDDLATDQRGLGRVDNLPYLPPGVPPDIGAYGTPEPVPANLVSKRFFLASSF